MIPCLKEVYCVRDAWTKLNVLSAKIMQVGREHCIHDKILMLCGFKTHAGSKKQQRTAPILCTVFSSITISADQFQNLTA